jgi:hypothetical protein
MFSVQVGLSGRAAKQQARYLAKQREKMLRERERAQLGQLRELVKKAQRRRREALQKATGSCKRARVSLRAKVKEFRARERARINQEIRELRTQARNRCQARKFRIRQSSLGARARAREHLQAERVLQLQLRRLEAQATRKRAKLTTRKERRQEADGEVRGNLPPELQGVWDKVKRTIKPGLRTTRTEAFLEWAEANPEEVLALQTQNVDREVAALVREYERQQSRPRARVSPEELKKLEELGLAKTRPEARRRAAANGLDDYVPF